MRNLVLILIGLSTAVMLSCEDDKIVASSADCPEMISFSSDVKPFILNNCSFGGCHNTPGPNKPALLNYSEISSNVEDILTVIRDESMPVGGPPVPDSLVNMISCWFEQGALDN